MFTGKLPEHTFAYMREMLVEVEGLFRLMKQPVRREEEHVFSAIDDMLREAKDYVERTQPTPAPCQPAGADDGATDENFECSSSIGTKILCTATLHYVAPAMQIICLFDAISTHTGP